MRRMGICLDIWTKKGGYQSMNHAGCSIKCWKLLTICIKMMFFIVTSKYQSIIWSRKISYLIIRWMWKFVILGGWLTTYIEKGQHSVALMNIWHQKWSIKFPMIIESISGPWEFFSINWTIAKHLFQEKPLKLLNKDSKKESMKSRETQAKISKYS